MNEVFLRRRTTARGQIDLATLRVLHDSFAVDYGLTGVVDRMKPARGDLTLAAPDLAFGARLIEADTGHLRTAWEIQRNGTDGETFLGFGRVHSLGQLVSDAEADLVLLLTRELDETPDDWDLGE